MSTPSWVVRRDESADEILTEIGTWATMDDARWFAQPSQGPGGDRP